MARMVGAEAMALEDQVIAFEKRLREDDAESHDRDYFATLALNLCSLSRALDKRFALHLEKRP